MGSWNPQLEATPTPPCRGATAGTAGILSSRPHPFNLSPPARGDEARWLGALQGNWTVHCVHFVGRPLAPTLFFLTLLIDILISMGHIFLEKGSH